MPSVKCPSSLRSTSAPTNPRSVLGGVLNTSLVTPTTSFVSVSSSRSVMTSANVPSTSIVIPSSPPRSGLPLISTTRSLPTCRTSASDTELVLPSAKKLNPTSSSKPSTSYWFPLDSVTDMCSRARWWAIPSIPWYLDSVVSDFRRDWVYVGNGVAVTSALATVTTVTVTALPVRLSMVSSENCVVVTRKVPTPASPSVLATMVGTVSPSAS